MEEENINPKCPRCGNEMNVGYLAGGGLGIAFYEGIDKYGIGESAKMVGRFFKGNRLFRLVGTKAWVCKNCREITFKY